VTVTLAPDITPSELATVPTNRPVLVCAKADAKLTQNTKDNNIAFFMIYLRLKTIFLNNFASVSSQQSPRFHYLEIWDWFLVTGENVEIGNVYASINA
jgi:hypothetical protein